jgi:uncharacterized protein (TIGR03435 family)
MAKSADPSFEVAAIKAGDPNQRPGFPSNGRNFIARSETVEGMLRYAYTIRSEQILNAPEWFSKDRFDITAVPNLPGQPDGDQWKSMLRKLLADRFQLALHREQRVLPVYVLTVGRNGPKLTASDAKDTGRNDSSISITNIDTTLVGRGETMASLAIVLQGFLLDRPVVNQTGLTGSFDFKIAFTPIVSNVGGLRVPDQDPNSSAASIFTAIQDLGLKLDATRQLVDVLIIERAEHPSLD